MKIFIASDHGGVNLKTAIVKYAKQLGHEVLDEGPFSTESVDYPNYAKKVCGNVLSQENSQGVLICRSGIGMSMAANKIKGIRAALCYNKKVAYYSRQHNNANILCLGADYISVSEANGILEIFLDTDFEGGRHARRIKLMEA